MTPADGPGAVVVGSGSAGRRHVEGLLRVRPDLRVTVVRRAGSDTPAAGPPGPHRFATSISESLSEGRPLVAVVASPAPFHRRDAVALLDAGATVLVEKPLADDLGDAAALVAADADGSRVVVGYHLRWADTALALRAALAGGAVGPLVGFDLRVGQHLGGWRPGRDPRRTVTARAELGGGVLWELSHELDAVGWLAGPVTEVGARLGFDGAPTDGVVDTVADLALVAGGVSGTVHLDMVAEVPFRTWELRGRDGILRADLLAGTVELVDGGGRVAALHRSGPGERDRAGHRLVAHLLDVAGGAAPGCTAAEAAATVAVVVAARASHGAGGTPLAVGAPAPTEAADRRTAHGAAS